MLFYFHFDYNLHVYCTFYFIATFFVQDFQIDTINGSVMVTCYFIENEFADGCQVHFSSSDNIIRPRVVVNITRPSYEDSATADVEVPQGVYSVLVYDMVGGKAVVSSAAYSTSYTVSYSPSTTSMLL